MPSGVELSELPGLEQEGPAEAPCVLRGTRRDTDSVSLCRIIAEQRDRQPNAVAVRHGGRMTSYDELVRSVSRCSQALRAAGCAPGDSVVVVGPRGVLTIALLLATENTGAVYVPIDPSWPNLFAADVIRNAAPAAAALHGMDDASTERWTLLLRQLDVPIVGDANHGALKPGAADSIVREGHLHETRYVIHTSGSSGVPKGVMVQHQGLVNHLLAIIDELELTPLDVVGFTAPPSHVISVWQMLSALLVGASVAIVDELDVKIPRRLISRAQSQGVTILELIPTAMRGVLQELRSGRASTGRLDALRSLISTGGPLETALAAHALETLPNVSLINAYGMTECSDDVAFHRVVPADITAGEIPAGRPIPNVDLHLLVCEEGSWRAAREGELGELFVGGVAVSTGYRGAPAGDPFFRSPFSRPGEPGRLYRTGDVAVFQHGAVFCRGRADRHVKIAGVSVDLNHVEAVLRQHPAVEDCGVVAVRKAGHAQLVAHCTLGSPAPWRDLQRFATARMPAAFTPREWHVEQSLPLTSSGKVDYRALAERDSSADDWR
ncbi:AMP-binding protein [Streptomyces diastatochromogenes]|uniref:AMP-binding protein n=1 Tax=Streptomyces diastatochromogenes TaxID=42236 RepID=UPI00364FE1E1